MVAVVKGAENAGQADQMEDELFLFTRLVAENPSLRDALSTLLGRWRTSVTCCTGCSRTR